MLDVVLAALPGAMIIMDALDEYIDKEDLLKWLRRMVTQSQRKSRVRIFTTGRNDVDIYQCLNSFGIQIETRTRIEMECYINNYIESHATMKSWGNDTYVCIKGVRLHEYQTLHNPQ
jgi:hypothetical protein